MALALFHYLHHAAFSSQKTNPLSIFLQRLSASPSSTNPPFIVITTIYCCRYATPIPHPPISAPVSSPSHHLNWKASGSLPLRYPPPLSLTLYLFLPLSLSLSPPPPHAWGGSGWMSEHPFKLGVALLIACITIVACLSDIKEKRKEGRQGRPSRKKGY
jgi:hypothetical protein